MHQHQHCAWCVHAAHPPKRHASTGHRRRLRPYSPATGLCPRHPAVRRACTKASTSVPSLRACVPLLLPARLSPVALTGAVSANDCQPTGGQRGTDRQRGHRKKAPPEQLPQGSKQCAWATYGEDGWVPRNSCGVEGNAASSSSHASGVPLSPSLFLVGWTTCACRRLQTSQK